MGRCGVSLKYVADRHVEAVAGQGADLGRQVELDRQFRVGPQEGRHQRHDVLAAQGHWCGHPQQAAGRVGELAHARKAALDLHKGLAGGIHQALAGFGKAQAAGGAAHQGHAGGGLELADAQAHGRLAHPQPGRRRGVAAGIGEHAKPMHMAPQGFDLLFFHHCIVQYSEQ